MIKYKWTTGFTWWVLAMAWIACDRGNIKLAVADNAERENSTIVLDASDFIERLPRDHMITNADWLDLPWLFNNTGLVMGSRSNYVKKVTVPEAGTYHLYVRSHGNENSYFRVAINDKVIETNVGDDSLNWKKVGVFDLKAGATDVRLMRIENRPVLDVLILTRKEFFSEEELRSLQLHPDVSLLKTYDIPESRAVKFGDVDGDGRMDFMALTPEYSVHVINHDGVKLWSWEAPDDYARDRASFEAPGLVWDLDRDGSAEAIHWRQEEGQEWLVAADGETGEIRYRTPWPTKPLPHVYNNFRLAIGNLDGDYPDEVIVFTDMGGQINITAYDSRLNKIWQHEEVKKKDHLGHYVYPVDLDADGIDEVVVGSLVLDADGSEIWNRFDLFYDHHDHVDSYRFDDIDGDGDTEIVTAHSEFGVVAFEAMTGEMIWQDMAEHTQQIETGHFLKDRKGPQVVVGARSYGNRSIGEPYLWSQLQWYSPDGDLLHLWPEKPVNGNPVFVKGDWNGNGEQELFWYKFRMNEQGEGDLYFGEPVYHMFDFTGNRAEEVITLEDGKLRVYGSRKSEQTFLSNQNIDADYLKNEVANHTHY